MNSKLLLGFSVTLNFVAVLFFINGHHSQKIDPAPSIPATALDTPVLPKVSAPQEQLPKPFNAAKVGWVQALRDAHISEKVIADVASANFEDRWHGLALENQKKFDRGEIDSAALTGLDLEHDEERKKEMRAALGDEGFRHWDKTRELADLDRAGVQLSGDENDKVYDLRTDLDRKRLALDKARHDGKLTDEQAASQSEALYAQYNQDLLKLVGDDRYAQIQNGGDTGVSQLKQNLRDITADDSQISGMQTAQQTWNSQRNTLDIKLQKGDITAEDYQQQMKALDTQRNQDFQTVLGTNGFAQFQRDQSEQYQILKRLGPTLDFTSDDVNNLYGMMQDYQNAVRDYRERAEQLQKQGQTIDWSSVDKVLANYSQQTETALREQLGDKFDKLKRSNAMPFER
jgi:hypothetical protein